MPRSNRTNQSNCNFNGNGLLGLTAGLDFKSDIDKSFPFFANTFDPQTAKMLDHKTMPLNSFMMQPDSRNPDAATAAAYYTNGLSPHLMGLNSILNMAALPNLATYPELFNILMRTQQFESKSFKESPDHFLASFANEEFEKHLLKNKALFENSDSVRKFLQMVTNQTSSVSKANPELNSAHVLANIDQNHSNNNNNNNNNNINDNINNSSNGNTNLSTSFLNLSKVSDFDQSNLIKKESDLTNGNSKKLEQPQLAKNGQTVNDTKPIELNGKSSQNNLKVESDEESQRDSSSLDDEVLADGKKVRVRSVLSEDTLRILRSQYSVNPRPKKQEILRLSEQVNYSPRVVQVWFQNMRYVCGYLCCFC